MTKIILASSNKGKIAEITDILSRETSFEIIPQTTLDISDIEETASTFVENAIIKARHATKLSGLPAIADDSGLEVDALQGAPGVYSSRYAPTDPQRIQKLLTALKSVENSQRSARYHCVLVLMRHELDPSPIIAHGIWEGQILHEARGDQGFGYDPIFYVPTHQCSAAQLDPAVKNEISHRARAMAEFILALQQTGASRALTPALSRSTGRGSK